MISPHDERFKYQQSTLSCICHFLISVFLHICLDERARCFGLGNTPFSRCFTDGNIALSHFSTQQHGYDEMFLMDHRTMRLHNRLNPLMNNTESNFAFCITG